MCVRIAIKFIYILCSFIFKLWLSKPDGWHLIFIEFPFGGDLNSDSDSAGLQLKVQAASSRDVRWRWVQFILILLKTKQPEDWERRIEYRELSTENWAPRTQRPEPVIGHKRLYKPATLGDFIDNIASPESVANGAPNEAVVHLAQSPLIDQIKREPRNNTNLFFYPFFICCLSSRVFHVEEIWQFMDCWCRSS